MRLKSIQESLRRLQWVVTITNIGAVTLHIATSECTKYTACPVKNQQCHSWQAVCTSPTTVKLYKQCCGTGLQLTHTRADTHPHTCTPPVHLFAFPAAWHHHPGVSAPRADWLAAAELLIRSKDHKVVPRGDISVWSLANGREMPGWL